MKELLWLVAGGAIGSIVTYSIVKEKYEQIANEEIEAMNEHYQKILDETNAEHFEHMSDLVEDIDKTENETDVVNYSNYTRQYKPEEVKKEDGDIQIISSEEFDVGQPNFDSITLYYYNGDGILAEENDEIVDNQNIVVGNIDLGAYPPEESVYIRNYKLRIDYEIIIMAASYDEYVLGN